MTATLQPPAPRSELPSEAGGDGARATWHPAERSFVLSLWRDDECRATARREPTEVARLATFLVASLGDALNTPITVEAPRPTMRERVRRFLGLGPTN
jgi:hypothetical protein